MSVNAASLLALPAEDWSAIAAASTAVLAGVAGVFAYRQVKEAQRLREEQAQPYVVAYLEPDASGNAYDLVVKNLGATAAYDVRVTFDREPRQAFHDDEVLHVPEVMPVLVPGQEWRSLWDLAHRRAGSSLPGQYTLQVAAKDSRGQQLDQLTFVVDWSVALNRGSVVRHGVHEAATALKEIDKSIRAFRESGASKGISVYVRSGEDRDRRIQERREARRQADLDAGTSSSTQE
jgi:hypothetical protein